MTKRNISIDFFKMLCAIFVIVTHLINDEISRSLYSRYWIDLAVPIFLILTGYNYCKSCEKNNIDTFMKWFSWSNLKKKLIRILIPYLFAVLLFSIFQIMTGRLDSSWLDSFIWFRFGPGCYYIAILLQILVLFPTLYYLQKRFGIIISLLFIILQFVFEYYANLTWMAESIYQLIAFRYTIFLIAGMNLDYFMSKIKPYILFIVFIIGAFYIHKVNYTSFSPVIFRLWIHSSMPTIFYCLPLVVMGIKLDAYIKESLISKAITTIGKASYHIFLTQMIYFNIGISYNLIRDVPLCIIIGVLFYYVETYGLQFLKSPSNFKESINK